MNILLNAFKGFCVSYTFWHVSQNEMKKKKKPSMISLGPLVRKMKAKKTQELVFPL